MGETYEASSPPIAMTRPDRPFVVGLGASAGGIAALKSFFAHTQPQDSTAYVVILHMSPDHDSRLAEVLQSTTPMPVTQVTSTTPIVANHIYVVPPNKGLRIVDGALTVAEFTSREQRYAPVDAFFRALADTHGSRSACVILSGTGPNGSAGLKRIKEAGGLVVAQDPGEAEYRDMPNNAIATGLVDLVLPVAEMPVKIHGYFGGIGHENEHVVATPLVDDPGTVHEVLTLLRVRTGHDFSNYKAPTLQRRIERRMTLRGISSIDNYVVLMRQEPEEAVSLMKELLISVTNFFRDSRSWISLQKRVIPRLFSGKGSQDQVRVWVPGCATGEEAYSVAMLLAEYASTVAAPPPGDTGVRDRPGSSGDRTCARRCVPGVRSRRRERGALAAVLSPRDAGLPDPT